MLAELARVGVRPETLSAVALIPLVMVAWADGRVDESERLAILNALGALEAARQHDSLEKIKQSISAVDKATQEFAARRMDAGMQKALAGHKLSEFSSDK